MQSVEELLSTDERPSVAVLGGAVAGLAAAERFSHFADVDLFERQRYAEKRVNCGEAFNDASLVPLEATPENGFLNRIEGFEVAVHAGTDRAPGSEPLTRAHVTVDGGHITDRSVVERRWAERLDERGVAVHEGASITKREYRDLVERYDYVVDATGQPALSLKAAGETGRYTGDIVALNADVEGDFGSFVRTPRIVFEGYVGYFWVFPKTASRANVGIGWARDARPDHYLEALWAACDRAETPRPPREAVNVYTIPRGPSLDPAWSHPEPNVFLVGDAAGIANRYQGEGISQAVRSSYLLADLVAAGAAETYPRRLFESMRSEYRLATLMLGVWETSEDPALMAAVTDAIDGLSVADVTRNPRRVAVRVAKRPRLAARLLSNPAFRRRIADAYRGRWDASA